MTLTATPSFLHAQSSTETVSSGALIPIAGRATDLPTWIKTISRMHFEGSMSFHWRNVGPRQPGYETQIQNEIYLSDMYFGITGPLIDNVPFELEWHMPTGSQGKLQLNQLYFKYTRIPNLMLQFGKFLVPFGRYNELYKPDEFLAVTRPLLYASPDSLDLVVRINSPRPPLSYGYTDIGARASFYPANLHPLMPTEMTIFVVNGLGETSNRQRTFPDPQNLGIKPPQANGVTIDFGHTNNNLADNNNYKSFGGRLVFGFGDVRLPWPIPEAAGNLKGTTLGFSGMGGQFDLEGRFNYQMYSLDFSFDYGRLNFSGEYLYSINNLLAAVEASSTTLLSPLQHHTDFETNQGYFIQASWLLMRKPRLGKRLYAILVFNQLFRRGPQLDLFLNYRDQDNFVVYPSLNAISLLAPTIERQITKYTAALNWQLTNNFSLKYENSYWVMKKATSISPTSLGNVNIYQNSFTASMSF